MQISGEIKKVHEDLADCSLQFLEFVQRNPEALNRSCFDFSEIEDDLFKFQPWPTFVNQVKLKEIKRAAVEVYRLIKSIPGRLFGYDSHRFSKYFNMPDNAVQFMLAGVDDEHIDNLLARGDFILSAEGLKCLEYNVTPNLGGWQSPIWELYYLRNPLIARFLEESGVNVAKNALFPILFDHIGRIALKKLSHIPQEINVLFMFPAYTETPGNREQRLHLSRIYQDCLRRLEPNCSGEVILGDFFSPNFADGVLTWNDKEIHIVVELNGGRVPDSVYQAFNLGKIFLYNGPIANLLSNKLNLALLSEHETSDIFSPSERETIERHIPWTRKCMRGKTTYRGEEIILEDFVLKNRQKMVLKPAAGYGGKDIYIGKSTPEEKWKEVLSQALLEENAMAQEYFDSVPYIYQWGENGYAVHDAVWGFFVFGNAFAGGWVRVLPRSHNKGVINCHQGAKVSNILEVEEY